MNLDWLSHLEINPEGIAASSPRMTAQRTTLGNMLDLKTTLMSVCRQSPQFFNPFRVEMFYNGTPRVARSAQPWAEGCNPFGIVRDLRSFHQDDFVRA